MTSTLRRTEMSEVLAYTATSVFVSVPDEFEPTTFRFTEVNPKTRRSEVPCLRSKTYAQTPAAHLPSWVLARVCEAGYSPVQWDEMVYDGTVLDHVAFRREYDLCPPEIWAADVALRRNRTFDPEMGLCEECWGTGLADDFDATVTGELDAPFVCFCMGGMDA